MVLAALTNALRVVEKELADVRIVVSGGGRGRHRDRHAAARRRRHRRRGRATARAASRADDDVAAAGARRAGRAHQPAPGHAATCTTVLARRRRLHRRQRARACSSPSGSRTWPTTPVVFALANPDPEVDPAEAEKYAAVVASGRSDYPNQINNVLAFPGVFRGLLDARA